ncbi:hypothetical protein AHAS_Ahas18G0159200 [Arachis hypogaea]
MGDEDEGSDAWSPEIDGDQSAVADREDDSLAGDEGSMPVSVADNPYADVEFGLVALTAASLESAEYHSVEDAYRAYVAFAKVSSFVVRKGDSVKDEEENIVQNFFYYN